MKVKIAALMLCATCLTWAQDAAPKPKADAIYVHGNVYTGMPMGASLGGVKREQAIAVRGDRVIAVGSNDEILKLKGPETNVIELGGKFVMPGFNDAHTHLAEGGFEKLTVNLVGVKSLDEFRERIRAKAEKAEPYAWIVGGGWDETLWPVTAVPTRWDIDEVTTNHPVFLQRVDGHIAVANTRALQLASVTLASKQPEGGKIDRHQNGHHGNLRDGAGCSHGCDSETKPRQEASPSRLKRPWLTRRSRESPPRRMESSGDDFLIYEELGKGRQAHRANLRVTPFHATVEQLSTWRKGASDRRQHAAGWHARKGFMDGSLGSHTAALLEPYADDDKNSGIPQYEVTKNSTDDQSACA